MSSYDKEMLEKCWNNIIISHLKLKEDYDDISVSLRNDCEIFNMKIIKIYWIY